MKRIYLHILAPAVTALTLTACGQEDIEPVAGDVAPTFTATIEGGQSRVIGSYWESGDKIGITGTGATNVCYVTYEGDGLFAPEDPNKKIFYKSSSDNTASWTFRAYYPWSGQTGPTFSTSDQTQQKSFDFLYAMGTGTKNSPEVNFKFAHLMSKVTFVFRNGKDFNVSDIKSYSLGDLYLNGKLNNTAISGDWTCSPSTSGAANKAARVSVDLTEYNVKADEPVTPLILIPQSVSDSVPFEIVSKNNQTFTVDLSFPSNKLVAGENYKFTITVSKTGLIAGNCTIEDWDDYEWPEGGGQGTADSADDPEEFNN